MENKTRKTQTEESASLFSIQEFLSKCASNWKWFVISAVIFTAIGAWYAMSQELIYSRSMQVLIKSKDGGKGIGNIAGSFSSLGLFSSNTNVNNELISLTSPAVMYEVVKKLRLDVNYSTPKRFRYNTLYGTNLPYLVTFNDLEEQQEAGFTIEIQENGDLMLSHFYLETENDREDYDKRIKVRREGGTYQTPVGGISIELNPLYLPSKSKKAGKIQEIKVDRIGQYRSVETYCNKVKGDLADKDADVIELTMKDESIERAVDVLDEIVAIYNENWIEDNNKISIATSKFIDERLRSIKDDLNIVDDDIAQYKSDHLVPDLQEMAKLQIQEGAEVKSKILALTNEMSMAMYLRDYLKKPANANNVIPVNTGVGSLALETQISNYNNILLNRNNLEANSSSQNPIVKEYDIQLQGLRLSIVNAIEGQISSMQKSLNNMEGAKGAVDRNLSSGPRQAKELLTIERDQKVKQELYLYLLQKKEENDLSKKFTADNTRIITPPMGSLNPIAPKKKLIVIVMFLLGLTIPGIWIYIKSAIDTKVRRRKDLDTLSVPFAGEIPYIGKRSIRERFGWLIPVKKKSAKGMEKVIKVVSAGSRDVVSESFRIMRGNLDFMNRRKGESSVILITSFNPGSGKSFISYNLSVSFALKGKRVLLVDGDLRHGSVSQFVNMPSKGLTNYLTGNADNWQQFVVANREQDNMFIMPIGHRPPNPAELIESGRMGEFIEEARKEFDYILIDCPPTDVVIDTRLMEQYADNTLFVVRAGLFDKKQLADIESVYDRKEFKNMCIVLNATTDGSQNKSYGSYAYYSND